ncbi:MAG: hypothetical protein ABL986_19430 [Vicinamibacterales bacterium]
MGRASRLKNNPDRERYRIQRRETARVFQQRGEQYQSDVPFETAVQKACVHEAGHIVASVALGLHVTYAIVTAEQPPGYAYQIGGYTEVALGEFRSAEEAQAVDKDPETLRMPAVKEVAGQIAESFNHDDLDDIRKGATDDDEFASKCALVTLRKPDGSWPDELELQKSVNAYLSARDTEAFELLKPRRVAINRVANYLMTHLNDEVLGATLAALVHDEETTSE